MAGTAGTKRKRPTAKVGPAIDFGLDDRIAALAADSGHEPINDDGTINPIEIGRAGRTPNRRVVLFSIDGTDYTVPEKPSPALMQRFLRDARKHGPSQAASMLLDTMIGEDALDALAECPDVTEEDMAAIYSIVTHLAFGKKAKKAEVGQDPS